MPPSQTHVDPLRSRLRMRLLASSVVLVGPLFAQAAPPDSKHAAPRELGKITWLRGFDVAAAKAKAQDRPLLVLFQEVPGCSTCTGYGDRVLSHPLIIDAAASLFVPVAIFNNVPGADERILKSFGERAWTNPVVRLITYDRKPLAPRVAGDYDVAGLASAMVTAVEKVGRYVPRYLRLLATESVARRRGVETATFAMHCFWEGEGTLGKLSGVLATSPGFVGKEEVVEVTFNPAAITYDALIKKAISLKCADRVYTRNDDQHARATQWVSTNAVRSDEIARPDKQPKYYLAQTPYKFVPMTRLQAARVNAAIYEKQDPNQFLSPSQIRLLEVIEKAPDRAWVDAVGAADLPAAWSAAQAIAAAPN